MSILSKIKSFIKRIFKRKEDELDLLIKKEIDIVFNHYNGSINYIQKADGYKLIYDIDESKDILPRIKSTKKILKGMIGFTSTTTNYIYLFPNRIRKYTKALYESDKDSISIIINYIVLHELSHLNQDFNMNKDKVIMEYSNDCNLLEFINNVIIYFYDYKEDKMVIDPKKFDMMKSTITSNLQLLSETGSIYGDPDNSEFLFITSKGLEHYLDTRLNNLYSGHRTSCMLLQFIINNSIVDNTPRLNELMTSYKIIAFGKMLNKNVIDVDEIYRDGKFIISDSDLYNLINRLYEEVYTESGSYLALYNDEENKDELDIVLARKEVLK